MATEIRRSSLQDRRGLLLTTPSLTSSVLGIRVPQLRRRRPDGTAGLPAADIECAGDQEAPLRGGFTIAGPEEAGMTARPTGCRPGGAGRQGPTPWRFWKSRRSRSSLTEILSIMESTDRHLKKSEPRTRAALA